MSHARIALLTLFALIIFAAAGYVLVFLGFHGVWTLMGVRDPDGGGAMAVGLVFAPIGGVVIGVIGALVTAIILSNRRAAAREANIDSAAGETRLLVQVVAAIVGFAVGWFVANTVRAVLYSLAYQSFALSVIFASTHVVLPLAFAIIGFFLPRYLAKKSG